MYRGGDIPYDVPEITCDECPVSFITPESRRIVDLEMRARRIKEATGAAFPSLNQGEWPAWWADAVAHLELMRILQSNSRDEEIERRRPKNGSK